MSSKTTNYNLHKIDLADSPPDITVLNNNFDIIDEELKSRFSVLQHARPTNTGYDTLREYLVSLKNAGHHSVSMQVTGFSDLPRTDWGYGCTARLDGNIQVQLWRMLSGGKEGILFRELDSSGVWGNDWTTAYLPLDGSVPMTGNMTVNRGTNVNGVFGVDSSIDCPIMMNHVPSDGGFVKLFLNKRNSDKNQWLRLADNDTPYSIFGEHNKPSGSYTGNGSGTGRTIVTGGIGALALVWSSNGSVLITPIGALKLSSSHSIIEAWQVAIDPNTASIWIATTDAMLNANGVQYAYRIL